MSTVTLTSVLHGTENFTLRLSPQPLGARLSSLLARVDTQEVTEWKAAFNSKYVIDSPNAQERERTAHALAFLLIQIVEEKHPIEVPELRDLISELLPDRNSVDIFVLQCKEKDVAFRIRQLKNDLSQFIRTISSQIINVHLQTEEQLVHLLNEIDSSVHLQYQELDTIRDSLQHSMNELQKLGEQINRLAPEIAKVEADHQKSIAQIEHVLSKV